MVKPGSLREWKESWALRETETSLLFPSPQVLAFTRSKLTPNLGSRGLTQDGDFGLIIKVLIKTLADLR